MAYQGLMLLTVSDSVRSFVSSQKVRQEKRNQKVRFTLPHWQADPSKQKLKKKEVTKRKTEISVHPSGLGKADPSRAEIKTNEVNENRNLGSTLVNWAG